MKIFKSILTKFIYLILILLVSFNVYNFVCINILKQDIPLINGYGILEVVSGSMEPTIDIGDLIVINTKYSDIKENDIITFYDENNSFVTHKVIKVDGNMITTKGDANNAPDKPFSETEVVGKYVTKVNGLGRIMSSFKSPFVMSMILIIGLLVCYLVSTDKEGKPIITKEEKEYEEFLEYKEKKKKESKVKKSK